MDCLFCNIYATAPESNFLYKDDDLMVIRDINPQAPTHFLVIPKKHIPTIDDCQDEDYHLIGKCVMIAKKIAKQEGITKNGYRLIWNVNKDAGQTVYHIHLHVLGGRVLTWPPG